jgi:hypothetical protein
MPLRYFALPQLRAWAAACLVAASCLGCTQRGPARVEKPDVDAQASAEKALELYDANGDAALDGEEIGKCPPLAKSLASYDADKDGRLTGDEISSRLAQLIGPSSAYVSVDGTVTLDGRPLVGATLKLRPAELFVDSLPPAEGTTDEQGIARPAIAADRLPADVGGAALVFPGLYHVEITHPTTQIPGRYNMASELGWEVDPFSRAGTTARFALTSK